MNNERIAKTANIISVIAVIAAFIPYSLSQSDKAILMTGGVCLAVGAYAQVVAGLITNEIKAGPIATFVKEKGPYDYWIAIALWAALGFIGVFLICWQIA